ncbi:choice-of-anchor U domain-containing protein, partial [Candidatus Parabeggiatoa sp. HSG14]|uniref:InlB B-repeat-containing protein n=1 Tax=Candidatus Parabeggiatoa sp. HSG14 TaxID=3055593 RepID=UPI0025A8E5C1|nr:choice-of-anchor U domain-containing protein [Thiotrichales bacterium HSG14]
PPPSYELTVEKSGGGTVSGQGISCGSDCQQSFIEGTEITLIATPYTSNYVFDSWSGDCDKTGTVIMSSEKTCTANFVIKHTLTLKTTGKGTIENCGTNCNQTYSEGETLLINATPDDGWAFRDFTGDCDSTGQVLMDGDKSCTVRFSKEYTLTLNSIGEGEIDNCGTECTQIHVYGKTVSLTAIPADSWNLSNFTGDCDNTGQVLINGDKSCTATFIEEFKLNVTSQNGTVTGDGIDCGTNCTQTYPQNTSVTLTAAPKPNFTFTGWAGDCVGTESTMTISLDTDKSCTAMFGPPCLDTPRLYVNQTASGQKTGCDWTNAITDLQAALTQVTTGVLPQVNEIWVAKGTYFPTTDLNREATFQLLNGVSIYGGFAGSEAEVSQNKYQENQTILSGDIGIVGDNSDNSYHVVTGLGTDATAVLHGVTITKGNASKSGGGLYNDPGSPTLHHISFTDNSALKYGGAIYNGNQSHPTLEFGFIKNNTATDGGGIYNDNSHPVISHVFLQSNTASNQGGGVFNQAGSNPILGHVNMSSNTAIQGGGIANNNSSPKISHSILSGNQATEGGGMVNLNQSSPVLSHVIFSGNSATQTGSALLNQNSTLTLSQTTITENLAPTGSGIVNQSSQATINNSIIWQNHPQGGIKGAQISDDANSQTTVNYSIIQGGWVGEGNQNEDPLFTESVVDHITTHTTVGNFHLSENSPAIDAGNNTLILPDFADAECAGLLGDGNTTEIVEIDYDGNSRLEDGNGDGTATVDMGAYEAPAIVLPNYPLTVTLTGEGSGTVTSNKVGIICGIDCTQDYQTGIQVLLIAQSDAGSSFSGWSGACSGIEDDILVEMTSAKNCEAQFDIAPKKQVSLSGITLICEDCNINNVALVAPEEQPVEPGNYFFPQGLVSFELTELENPQAHLDIYYYNINQLDNFVYRKYGPTIPGDLTSAEWYTFTNITISLDTLEGQTVLKATLTLTDGALGDSSGIDGRIIDPGGIALLETEESLPPTIIPEEIPVISIEQEISTHCKVIDGVATGACNVKQQLFPDAINIGPTASISRAVFEANVENTGLISNSTIGHEATLTGGKLTGNITNEGTITDIEFVGAKLSGGTLSGTITNSSEVGGVIENVQLAPDTKLSGGKLAGEISGDPENPPLITNAIIAPGTILENVRLSPTVQIPDDVVLGAGVVLPSEPPTIEDFGLDESDLANLDTETLGELEPEIFEAMTAEQLAIIPPEALEALQPEQLAQVSKDTLSGLTTSQFQSVPVQTLAGLTTANMGGFSSGVLNEFTPRHLEALQRQEFQKMPSQDVSKLFTNFNAEKIDRANVLHLIPNGWQINANTGAITAPIGAKLTPRTLPASGNIPAGVKLPQMADLGEGMGLGGQGTPIRDNMTRSLEEEDLTNFELSQNPENGFLIVEGTGDSEGINYSFIPDIDNVIQVDGEKIPIGLAVTEGGFYTITTPDEKQYKVVPAPKDPVALSQLINGGEVIIGKRGDVLMEILPQTRQRGSARQVVIFDPLIELAPDDLCVEIEHGEVVCDFDNAPESMQPGLHLDDTRTRKLEQAKVIYPDGTSQTIKPTLLSPDMFKGEGFKIEGVEDVVFNSNGVFYVLHKGTPYLVMPNFKVETQPSIDEKSVEPSIVINDFVEGEDYTLTYTIATEPQEEVRTRQRGKAREVLIFEPLIELAPDDLCVEITLEEIVCDFDNMLAE